MSDVSLELSGKLEDGRGGGCVAVVHQTEQIAPPTEDGDFLVRGTLGDMQAQEKAVREDGAIRLGHVQVEAVHPIGQINDL